MGLWGRQVVVLGLFDCLEPSVPLSLGSRGSVEVPQWNVAITAALKEKKKKGTLPDSYAETRGTVVSFFQEEAKELVENILVSLGVARFKCAGEKGVRGKEVEHIYSIYLPSCV